MSVLQEFREAIALHQRKDDEAFEEQMRLPLDERIAKGITMTGVRVEFEYFDDAPNQWCPMLSRPYQFIRSARIHCANNISIFREGAIVQLTNGSVAFRMSVKVDTIDDFILAPNDFDVKECYINTDSVNELGWEVSIVKTNITSRLLSATAGNLEHDNVRLGRIERLLDGTLENSVGPFNYSLLNESQNEAIETAVGASKFHLIQGPPGTGKTTTIAHLAKVLLDQGKSVFVTAPTHTAINNCLNAIANLVGDEAKVLKIGEKYQAAEILQKAAIRQLDRYPYAIHSILSQSPEDGIVIGGTPFCMCYPASKRLNQWEFDVALIDEAAQMSIPLAVSVMSKTDKFIFVGDHQQLDPIIPKGTGSSMFSESIFQRLVRLYPANVSLLNTSYRLNDGLIRIPNALFYGGRIKSAPNLRLDSLQVQSGRLAEVWNHPDPKILLLHEEFDSQGRSPYEARLVAELVADLRKSGVAFSDIGILSPYRAQVREIKRAIVQLIGGLGSIDIESFFVDTVDRMQGQERDFIIYSMSNSHPLESKRRLDFFYSPNRLNEAITRARKKCIVIANYKVFDIKDEELFELPNHNELKPSLDLFKQYYALSAQVQEAREEEDW